MSPKTKHFYEFGDFRLDPSEKLLTRGGEAIPITPKVFETLLFFVENAGRLLEKDELMRRIWQDRFVEESNLTFNIKMLRKALGDSASRPKFVETVPRRGYRFIAEVRENTAGERETSLPPARRSAFLPLAGKSYFSFAAVAVLVGLVVLGLQFSRTSVSGADSSSAPILSAPFRSEKLSGSGKVGHAVISPDGKLIAYTDETNGKVGVWLRRLETSETFQILAASEDFYLGLAFARDGQSLFFVRKPQKENSPSAVYRVSVFGGAPEKLLEGAEGWISLSPDDRQISFVRCLYADEDFCSLFAADADGKNERRLATRPRPFRIGDNQFSPDGKTIAFAAGQSLSGGSDFRLLKLNLESGAESEISPKTFFNIKNLEWLPDGDGLLLTAKQHLDGKLEIWQVSGATGEARSVTQDATDYSAISLNDKADKMIATRVANNFRLHLATGGETRVLTAARSTAFAPDGKLVYSDEKNIWTITLDGGEQRQLTNNAAQNFMPVASRDGRFIFFTSNRAGVNHIWRMNADGGDQTQLTENEGGYPAFVTPDGKWVYYLSGIRQTLWRVAAEGGGETEVSEQKMYNPEFTPDGALLAYFFRRDGWKIGVMNASDRRTIKIIDYAEGKSPPVNLAWASDNRTLYFIARRAGTNSLWRQSLDEDAPRFAADLGSDEVADFALAPGGDGFAYVRGEWLHDALLIEGLK